MCKNIATHTAPDSARGRRKTCVYKFKLRRVEDGSWTKLRHYVCEVVMLCSDVLTIICYVFCCGGCAEQRSVDVSEHKKNKQERFPTRLNVGFASMDTLSVLGDAPHHHHLCHFRQPLLSWSLKPKQNRSPFHLIHPQDGTRKGLHCPLPLPIHLPINRCLP